MVDSTLAFPEDTKLHDPRRRVVVNRKGEQLDLFVEAPREGLRPRSRRRHRVTRSTPVPQLRENVQAHRRGRRRPAARARRPEASGFCGVVRDGARATATAAQSPSRWITRTSGKAEHLFSAKFACPICNYSLPELEPRLFSFNNPMGALPALRRPRQHQLLRSQARGGVSAALPRLAARSRAGIAATSSTSRCSRASRSTVGFDLERAVRAAAEAVSSKCSLSRPGGGEDPVRRTCASAASRTVREHAFRGHHSQPRAALPARPIR